ncbi:hypothetical protein ACQCVB_19660 [Fictibacillus phosphorivorans]
MQVPVNLILGPIVAPDDYIAASLINALASNHQGNLPFGHHELYCT